MLNTGDFVPGRASLPPAATAFHTLVKRAGGGGSGVLASSSSSSSASSSCSTSSASSSSYTNIGSVGWAVCGAGVDGGGDTVLFFDFLTGRGVADIDIDCARSR
jgi:hypothetical protein